MTRTVFLLSPAYCGGRRAQFLLSETGRSALAVRLRETGIPLGEAFSFMSGLYFRGKLAYARAFAKAEPPGGVLVIVPGEGLVAPDRRVTPEDLRTIASVGVDADEPRFRLPLERDARLLAGRLEVDDRAVLLGSIATDKYTAILKRSLQDRLHFPLDFVGRGDMSRGGLLLRSVRDGRELHCVPIAGAARRGRRPPRLAPLGPGAARS